MLLFSEHHDLDQLDRCLRDAPAVTADLILEIIGSTRRRFPNLERLVESGAWTDAALALLELELPQWRLRRLAWDDGEWHCALSRQPELPEWLDQSIETHHADLVLAILRALVEARHIPSSRPSVPAVPRPASPLYDPVLCDNFA